MGTSDWPDGFFVKTAATGAVHQSVFRVRKLPGFRYQWFEVARTVDIRESLVLRQNVCFEDIISGVMGERGFPNGGYIVVRGYPADSAHYGGSLRRLTGEGFLVHFWF